MRILLGDIRYAALIFITILLLALGVPAGAVEDTLSIETTDTVVTEPSASAAADTTLSDPTISPDTSGYIEATGDSGIAGTPTLDSSAATISAASSSTSSTSSTTSTGDSTPRSPPSCPAIPAAAIQLCPIYSPAA